MNYQIQSRTISGLQSRISELEDSYEKDEPNLKKLEEFLSSGRSAGSTSKSESYSKHPTNDYVTKDVFNKLLDRITGNDYLIDGLTNKVKKINLNIDNKGKTATPQFSAASSGKNDEIEARIKNMQKDLNDLKTTIPANNDLKEMKNSIINLQQMIDEKPDFEQLQEIDRVVTDKLNDCIKAVRRQMQEKTEQTKNLKKLEKQLRSLYDVLYNQVAVSESEEDLITGKRPSSAYDRNMTPKRAETKYATWKKPPQSKKAFRIRSKGKDLNKVMSNTGDLRTIKYYNVGPISHHTQSPDF
jgi:hypothetical protein